MATFDRLVIVSTILFGTAGLLVLFSISRPRWILSINQGKIEQFMIVSNNNNDFLDETSIGLIEICITAEAASSLNHTQQKCFIPHHIRSVWIISFGLSLAAVGLLLLTVLLFLASQYTQVSTIEYGRLTGFIASTFVFIFFCFFLKIV